MTEISIVTAAPTIEFSRLAGLRLVLPRRPSHWRHALDESAHSLGFKLQPLAEADSPFVQKELVACTPGLYAVFGSYADTPNGRIVTVFFLEGGRPTFGPKAAELTGEFYRALWDKSYFQQKTNIASDGAVGGGTK